MPANRQLRPLRAGGIDWAEHWRNLVETRRGRIESLAQQGPPQGYWDKRADTFARLNRELDQSTDTLLFLLTEALGEGGTLLDVGAGTGRYTLPLAQQAELVTGVEPSAGMRAHIEREVMERGLKNVTLVPTSWEEADVGTHDVVLCSHVLYPIAEVVPFVEKLDAHARRACFVTLRVDQMVPQLAPLWPDIWGIERPPEPGALDLLALLYQLGLRANLRLTPFSGPGPFENLDDAVARARQLLFLPPGVDEHDEHIRDFLNDLLVRREDGMLTWPAVQQAAIVWWAKQD